MQDAPLAPPLPARGERWRKRHAHCQSDQPGAGDMNQPLDSAAPPPPDTPAGWKLLALLIAISSVGPLSVNIIVPAIPGLAVAFAADPAVVQLAVSLYFGGLGLAQLALGSLSDRFGRRPVLLGGFAVTGVTRFGGGAGADVGV